jgi:hypothetical protein
LFIKDKIVAQEKEEYIKNSIHTPAGGIPVGSLVKKLSEKGIKKVKCIINQWFQKKRLNRLKFTHVGCMLFGISSSYCFVQSKHF